MPKEFKEYKIRNIRCSRHKLDAWLKQSSSYFRFKIPRETIYFSFCLGSSIGQNKISKSLSSREGSRDIFFPL